MENLFNSSLLSCKNPFKTEGRFVFKTGGAQNRAFAQEDEEEEDGQGGQQERIDQQQERERAARRNDLQTRVNRANINPQTRVRLREMLASGSLENENLVERFLRNEVESENAFIEEADRLDRENALWGTIFNTQRQVRTRIQELQFRTETYMEIVPRGRQRFERMLQEIRQTNVADDRNDRMLRTELHQLVVGNPATGIPAEVLSAADANTIYSLDPSRVNLVEEMSRFRDAITANAGNRGLAIYRRLMDMKRQEARTEVDMTRHTNQLNTLISQKLIKVRNSAEKERFLETASESIGITLRPGTTIEYQDPEILPVQTASAEITQITWDDIDVRDTTGKVIDRVPGTARIHLSDGSVLPIGRFKKWIDAANGVEHVDDLSSVHNILGLAQYGINVKPGLDVSYRSRSIDGNGEVQSRFNLVKITSVQNGRVNFDAPVEYQPGLDNVHPVEMRNSLTLGEFVKWWRRYQAEKALGLHELRDYLIKYNEIENHLWGIPAMQNPPIMVVPDEELVYPDEDGITHKILRLDPDGVVLDSGKKMFPEFFTWVKQNHVRRKSADQKSPQQLARDQAKASTDADKKMTDQKIKELKEHAGLAKLIHADEELKTHKHAGGPIESLKKFWFETEFLTLVDLKNMVHEIVEFVKRKHERRSKGRLGEAGSRLPSILGTEFERIKQEAEDGEVNKYKEAMEHWGIPQVQDVLHKTYSKDECKAAILTLVHKGEMRWDDHHFYHTLNNLTARYTLRGAELFIPHTIPWGQSGEDLMRGAVDALWGEGTAAEWVGENTSKYNSMKDHFEYTFKQLENDPKGIGGPAGYCHQMLKDWRAGKYVNGQEYEEMIDAAIKYGKMSAEAKIFFLIAGVVAKKGDDEDGESLLHLDRVGELDSKYLNQFPLLDFFTQTKVTDYSIWNPDKKPKPGWGKDRKFNIEDYKEWVYTYFPDDYKNCKPGAQFSRFLWEKMLTTEEVRTRVSKGVRNAENIDHDDAHLVIPLAAPSEIDDLTGNATGQKKKFTNEGYCNGLVGFGNWIMTLNYAIGEAETDEDRNTKIMALRDAFNSFIRYDLILDNRYHRDKGAELARLDNRHYNRPPVVDDVNTGFHQKQLRNLMLEVGAAYGLQLDFLYQPKFGPNDDRAQKEYEGRVEQLKEQINRAMQGDNGQKAIEVVQRVIGRGREAENGLRGLPDSSRPDPAEVARLQAKRKAYLLEHAGGHGHGGGHH